MPVRKMIAAHPLVGGHINEPLAEAVRHAMDCALTCIACADACLGEEMDMRQCIRMCLDCADICDATMKLAVRRTGSNADMLRAMLRLCAEACNACADECEKHEHKHCQICAAACRLCAADCERAIATLN